MNLSYTLFLLASIEIYTMESVQQSTITNIRKLQSEDITLPNLTKVLVPSVYTEYNLPYIRGGRDPPKWLVDPQFHQEHNYSVVLYQKHDPTMPNYIKANRGTEGGVYLRYIVDHYDNFPDVAMFVHAHPQDHQRDFIGLLDCVRPDISYTSINTYHSEYHCRTSNWWDSQSKTGHSKMSTWMEQCWRNVIRLLWNLESDPEEFYKRLPINEPVKVCFHHAQQFVLSREMVHKRTLGEWKKLLYILGEDSACVHGEPDYEHLYAYRNSSVMDGPEPREEIHVQGGTSEHLAHVIYGQLDLETPANTLEHMCKSFYPRSECPTSPCPG